MSKFGQFGLVVPLVVTLLLVVELSDARGQDVWRLWPAEPPGEPIDVGPERDFTKPEDRLIAGRRIIKLGNVSQPEMHVYLAPDDVANGSAIVICPGGGFSILAWDLEGTEVADWLNSHGIAAVLLKYRVPTREQEPKWLAPVQDAQRAISLTRANAEAWNLKAERIGILGFSAGGKTAADASFVGSRQYVPVDEYDEVSCQPDLAVLIYPAYLANDGLTGLRDELKVDADGPPVFMVHAFDDPVPVQNSLLLMSALKQAGVASELHVYATGGHGYGMRPVEAHPVTRWADRCEEWLKGQGWIE